MPIVQRPELTPDGDPVALDGTRDRMVIVTEVPEGVTPPFYHSLNGDRVVTIPSVPFRYQRPGIGSIQLLSELVVDPVDPPGAPVVAATATSDTTISLAITPGAEAESHSVYRGTTTGFTLDGSSL